MLRKAISTLLLKIQFKSSTKETMDDICKNVLKKDKIGNDIGQESINDDLEEFISDLRNDSLRPDSKWLYFLPKLVARGPISEIAKRRYRDFCILKKNPDVPEEEMALSESKSKYSYSVGWRRTRIFENYEKIVPDTDGSRCFSCTGCKRKMKEYSITSDMISYGYLPKNKRKSKNK